MLSLKPFGPLVAQKLLDWKYIDALIASPQGLRANNDLPLQGKILC